MRNAVTLLAFGFMTLGLTACRGAAVVSAQSFAGELPPFREGARFAVVSDFQRTSLVEFWRESNDVERQRVVAAIAEAQPAFLVIGGDLVFEGSSVCQWTDFDALFAPIRGAGVPVVAAFGNHDSWGGRKAETHFFARFPHLKRKHWFAVAYGPIRILVLDTNIRHLNGSQWRDQLAWFEAMLDEFDRSPEVQGVLVLGHHPPYTNSTVTKDEEHVQRYFLPAFFKARKTLAMISGHVHSYERFIRQGKTFVVSGGGGGPRARLASGTERRHLDDLFPGPPLRDFNFLLLSVRAHGVDVEVMGLAKGGSHWREMDRFAMHWHNPSEAAAPGHRRAGAHAARTTVRRIAGSG